MDKLVYASDLDQTLIFSRRFLDAHPSEGDFVCVERRNDTDLSYMDREVQTNLKRLAEDSRVVFIPVTTRDLMRYNRVELWQGAALEYAIVSNGGFILHNGNPIPEWSEIVTAGIDHTMRKEITRYFETKFKTRSTEVEFVDSIFLLCKIDDVFEFDAAVAELDEMYYDWQFERQGHKCLAIPANVTKGSALKWLCENKLNPQCVVTSGDGVLDLQMLRYGDYAFIPDTSPLRPENVQVAVGGARSALKTMDFIEKKLEEILP
ncbi:MAG: HAD hydrolase family protein [Oscillospiraceae bacterium]|nr:HAD hydrolase family protein [Oscillospiraceae bacterium]